MKILGVNGSPRRNGNSEILLNEVLQEAKHSGAEIDYIHVDALNLHGCKGCLWCQHDGNGLCIQKDEMISIYDKIKHSDAIVMASPIYFSGITSQLKMFIDRLYPFYGRGGTPSRLPKKIKLILIITQGQPESEKYAQSIEIVADSLRLIGFDVLKEIFVAPSLPNKGDALQNSAYLEQAKSLGQKILL